jgi:hypothetical protein
MHDGILFASLVVLILYVFRVFQFLFGSDTFTKKGRMSDQILIGVCFGHGWIEWNT